MSAVDEGQAPVISVVHGRPTPTELAAVVAVLLAAGSAGGSAPTAPARSSAWADRARAWRVLPRPGPQGWRASARPR